MSLLSFPLAVIVGLLAVLPACVGPAGQEDEPIVDRSLGRTPPFVYTFEQLRTGDIDHILHGSGPLWNTEEHDAYRQAFASYPPYLVRFDINIRPSRRHGIHVLVRSVHAALRDYGDEIPVVTLLFEENHPDGTGHGLGRDVIAGRLDPALTLLASVLRDARRPVFLRIGPEVNGSWSGYDPEVFPAAYRYIVRLLKREGCHNAIFMWNVKAVLNQETPYIAWYPGDEWVDWWSIDLFENDFGRRAFGDWVRRFLADARRRGKPVMIPESCPNGMDLDSETTWRRWFQPYFALINGDPNIKAFCYSNRDFAKHDVKLRNWGNMRIDQSALAPRWRRELAKPQYLHARRAASRSPATAERP